jgi:hypothetical protein
MATQKQEQEQREKLLSIEQTIRENVIPTINDVKQTVNTIAQKEYITEEKADSKYADKKEMKIIKFVVYTGLSAVITGLVGLFFLIVQRLAQL